MNINFYSIFLYAQINSYTATIISLFNLKYLLLHKYQQWALNIAVGFGSKEGNSFITLSDTVNYSIRNVGV